MHNTIKKNIQPLLVLAVPLALTGILEYGVFFFETLFLARLGPNELAAGGLVSWLFGTFFVILFGVLSAINVLVAQKHGAGDTKGISLVLRDGLYLTLLFLLPCCLLFWNMTYLFLCLGQDPVVVALAKPYLHALVWGIFPDLVMIALLEFMIGLGHTRAILVFSILAVPVTIFLSFALIFGKFGLPALGIAGAGWQWHDLGHDAHCKLLLFQFEHHRRGRWSVGLVSRSGCHLGHYWGVISNLYFKCRPIWGKCHRHRDVCRCVLQVSSGG